MVETGPTVGRALLNKRRTHRADRASRAGICPFPLPFFSLPLRPRDCDLTGSGVSSSSLFFFLPFLFTGARAKPPAGIPPLHQFKAAAPTTSFFFLFFSFLGAECPRTSSETRANLIAPMAGGYVTYFPSFPPPLRGCCFFFFFLFSLFFSHKRSGHSGPARVAPMSICRSRCMSALP